MKKKITLYYDDENNDDIDLLKYIDAIKGKSSRTAFIMNTLNDLKNEKLTYGKPVPQYQIIQSTTQNKENNQEIIPQNRITEEDKENFKKRFGKG